MTKMICVHPDYDAGYICPKKWSNALLVYREEIKMAVISRIEQLRNSKKVLEIEKMTNKREYAQICAELFVLENKDIIKTESEEEDLPSSMKLEIKPKVHTAQVKIKPDSLKLKSTKKK